MRTLVNFLALAVTIALALADNSTVTCPDPECSCDQIVCTDHRVPPAPACPSDTPVTPPACPPKTCSLPSYKSVKQVKCNPVCEVTCHANEIRCDGTYDVDGCKGANTCMVKPACGPDPICPRSEYDVNGCQVSPECNPETQMSCPNGPPATAPEDGTTVCPTLNHCQARFSETIKDRDGMKCEKFCPVYCKHDEVLCSGGHDGRGCMVRDTCVQKVINGTTTCPSSPHDANGCMTQEDCAAKDEQSCVVSVGPEACVTIECKPVNDTCDPIPLVNFPPFTITTVIEHHF